jgi:hypothetical protein
VLQPQVSLRFCGNDQTLQFHSRKLRQSRVGDLGVVEVEILRSAYPAGSNMPRDVRSYRV